jgi:PAS domain S-box-containing protein
VAIIRAVSAAIVCGLIWYSARVLDDVARDSSLRVMQAKLAELECRSSVDVKDRSWWNEAQVKLFGERNTIWAEDNFGSYAHDSLGWATVFISGADGDPLFGWIKGESFGRSRNALQHFDGGLDLLIELAQQGPMEEPEAAVGILVDENGVPHIVAVSPFTWEVPTVEQLAPARRPILAISLALDGPALAGIFQELNVRDLRILPAADPDAPLSMAMIGPDGYPVGILTWSLDLPGERLISTVLPAILGAFLVMSWLLWLVFGRAGRAARQIENGARLLAAQNSAIERREQRIRGIMDNVADGIFTINPDGGLESANPGALRLFGYDAPVIMGKDLVSLIDCPEGFQILATFRASEEVPSQVQGAIGRRADGTTFPVDLSMGEVVIGDRRLLTGVVRGMTEREKQAENLRVARDVAEQADRAKSDFLAHISHELRTPLNAIIGFSEMYTSKIFGARGDKRYDEYVVHIHDSGKHLLALINDILDLSRADARRLDLFEDYIGVGTVIDASVEMVRQEAADGGFSLEVEAPDNLPRLRADERRGAG